LSETVASGQLPVISCQLVDADAIDFQLLMPNETQPATIRITFLPDNRTFEFQHGKLPYQNHGKPGSILDIALHFGLHLEHACGGNCACTTCHVVVKRGRELLNEIDDEEADRLDMAAGLQLNSRLGCQTVVIKPGEVVLEIPAWNRNYVSEADSHSTQPD
jgi:2Fe-2S ferredoxin